MENYVKDCVREVDDQSEHPFENYCSPEVIHMKVKASSRTRSILDYAIRHFVDDCSQQKILVSGSANGSTKAIGCAELLKQKCRNKLKMDLFQMTRIGYKTVEELWKAKDKNLDTLKVIRKVPVIHILLSKEALDLTADGVQYKDFNICNQLSNRSKQNRTKQKSKNWLKNKRKGDKEMDDQSKRRSDTEPTA